jgi:hypothetical protein
LLETLQTNDSDWDAVVLIEERLPEELDQEYLPEGLEQESTVKENKKINYIELESLVELLVYAVTTTLETFNDHNAEPAMIKCLRRLESFQALRKITDSQRGWHQSARDRVAG